MKICDQLILFIKLIAYFHFKLLHKILPSSNKQTENLDSNTCGFSCITIKAYDEFFISCNKVKPLQSRLKNIISKQNLNIKLTYKLAVFGDKIKHKAYNILRIFLSHISMAIYSKLT